MYVCGYIVLQEDTQLHVQLLRAAIVDNCLYCYFGCNIVSSRCVSYLALAAQYQLDFVPNISIEALQPLTISKAGGHCQFGTEC